MKRGVLKARGFQKNNNGEKVKNKNIEVLIEMIKENFDTSIDRLVEYVNANGSVSVTNAAKVLAMNPDEVEKLGEVLAESGLISIKYELTNTVLYAKKNVVAKPMLAPPSKQLAVEESKKIEKQVVDSESIFEFISSDLNKRINLAQNSLSRLSQQSNINLNDVEKTESEVQNIIQEVHMMENNINGLYKKIYVFDQQLQTFKLNIKKLETKKPSIMDRIKSIFMPRKRIEVIPAGEVEEADRMKEKTKILGKKLSEKEMKPLEVKEFAKKIEIPKISFEKIIKKRKEKKIAEKPKEKREKPAEVKRIEKIRKAKTEKIKTVKPRKIAKRIVKTKHKKEEKIKTVKPRKIAKRIVKTKHKKEGKIKKEKFKRNGVWIEAWLKNGRFFKIKELGRVRSK